jgi:hypothetical protein
MQSQIDLANLGTVVSVRGSVVDIRFDEHLPPIHSELRAGEEIQQTVVDELRLNAARSRFPGSSQWNIADFAHKVVQRRPLHFTDTCRGNKICPTIA